MENKTNRPTGMFGFSPVLSRVEGLVWLGQIIRPDMRCTEPVEVSHQPIS